MFRIKAYHKADKMMYKVASIDWAANSVSIFAGEHGFKNVDFENVLIFHRTPYFLKIQDKRVFIYEGDFLVANIGEDRRISGIVKKQKCGLWILKNKKTNLEIPLSFLFKEKWEVKNFKNAYMFFQRERKA